MSRRTIERESSLAGRGLHTGVEASVCCRPAESGTGIVFRRTDLDGTPKIPARLTEVQATERRTVLGSAGRSVDTVEHLLAAVTALELDDLHLDVSGPEVPILDGSFKPYMELLRSAGTREQPGESVIFRVETPFQVSQGDASYVVGPGRALRVTATIEWAHPLIRRQTGSYDITPEGFAAELAAARTFGFADEVEALRARGLLKGASPEHAIVLAATDTASQTLRWPDEFVRHKAGDIVGDLALIGGRVQAHVVATKPSHQGNIALARALARTAQRAGGIVMDINQILDVIPHRYPFLLVDRILEVEGTTRIVGLKNVTINEPFFQGHFPGHPIMPGVLIVEAMAQTGGLLLLGSIPDRQNKVVYFMSIDGVKFRRPVVPGDQLRLEVEMLQFRGKTCRMKGLARVDGHLAAEAEMMARVVDK